MIRKPEKKTSVIWFLQSIVATTILASVLTAAVYFLADYNLIYLVTGFQTLAAVSAIAHTFYRYASWEFEVRENHLYLEHGVLRKVYTMVPFVRIQHVDTQRNVLDRLLGLSGVVVYTAGSRGADVKIPGLDPGQAEELQGKLRDKAIESEDRDGV
ncbi:MAG: PH domain-containing protein [Candidatus Nanosalina sp.]